jgi:hypothetical protein
MRDCGRWSCTDFSGCEELVLLLEEDAGLHSRWKALGVAEAY